MEQATINQQDKHIVYDKKSEGPDSSDSKEIITDEKRSPKSPTTDLPPYHGGVEDAEVTHLDTAEDIVTTVIDVDDDPTLNPWTFRMFFIGIILLYPRTLPTRWIDEKQEWACHVLELL